MYNILNPKGVFDASPFQFAKMTYLRQRVDENYQKYVTERAALPGRVDSSHLLFKILNSITVRFDGDMIKYMDRVAAAATQLVPTLKLTSSYSKGTLFTESLFYDGCPEIIIAAQNPHFKMMDLWTNWRDLEPVWVVNHPISDLTIFEPAVMNSAKIESSDLAVICIDIPLLFAKYRMFKSTFPEKNMEVFVTGYVLPQMMKSHLNVALFNKCMAYLDIRNPCGVKSNLPFAQNIANLVGDEVAEEVLQKLVGKAMTGNQILSTIPSFYGDNYLNTVRIGGMSPTAQVLWALTSHKVDRVAVVLELGKQAGFDRMLDIITVIKRNIVNNQEDKVMSNGLSTAASIYLTDRYNKYVVQRLPT